MEKLTILKVRGKQIGIILFLVLSGVALICPGALIDAGYWVWGHLPEGVRTDISIFVDVISDPRMLFQGGLAVFAMEKLEKDLFRREEGADE